MCDDKVRIVKFYEDNSILWPSNRSDECFRGGFGEVYDAKKLSKEKLEVIDVVVKYDTTQDHELVKNEIEKLAKCQHKSVVKLLSLQKTKLGLHDKARINSKGIVMEAADLDLDMFLYELTYSYQLSHIHSWMAQITDGLNFIHGLAIIHRDLKPANVLLFECGKISKIADFGTACANTDGLDNYTGTPAWMAPEVMRGSYGEKCDIYSLAIILWQILTRKKPYPQYNNDTVAVHVFEGLRPDTSEILPEFIQNETIALLSDMWDGDAPSRPSASDLNEFFDGLHRNTIIHPNIYDKNEMWDEPNNPFEDWEKCLESQSYFCKSAETTSLFSKEQAERKLTTHDDDQNMFLVRKTTREREENEAWSPSHRSQYELIIKTSRNNVRHFNLQIDLDERQKGIYVENLSWDFSGKSEYIGFPGDFVPKMASGEMRFKIGETSDGEDVIFCGSFLPVIRTERRTSVKAKMNWNKAKLHTVKSGQVVSRFKAFQKALNRKPSTELKIENDE